MVEINPIVHALVEDGMIRARNSNNEDMKRIELVLGDSREYLKKLKPWERPDVVYLDPMFPEKAKEKSAVKKEMQILRFSHQCWLPET